MFFLKDSKDYEAKKTRITVILSLFFITKRESDEKYYLIQGDGLGQYFSRPLDIYYVKFQF